MVKRPLRRPGLSARWVCALVCLGAVLSVGSTPAGAAGGGWVRDTVHSLDIFSPDAASEYYFNAFGTASGARTVISGQEPKARYWSFTLYPSEAHVYDSQVDASRGRYILTIAASCHRVKGSCLATGTQSTGIVLMRIYVPVDLRGAGTGGVPLPTLRYLSAAGQTLSAAQAGVSSSIAGGLVSSRLKQGTLPAALTATYPPAPAVPVPDNKPVPHPLRGGNGSYANPDNHYQKFHISMLRGDLVVSAKAPTYRTDSFPHANKLNRPASKNPDTRYWSLCVDYVGNYTGACLRDEQVHVGADGRFTVVVAPNCPVAGYDNCIPSGPVALARTLLYRNMLPSKRFASVVFTGPYSLTARYFARSG